MSDPIVTTTAGAVRGRAVDGARVYLDIPYAAPPVGAARFAAPQPHEPWHEVRDGTRPGPTAPQPHRGGFGKLDMSPYFGAGWVPGADYLTLNVWAPPDARDKPVMVFVHGGGFVSGSTRTPLYDGTAFARDGVVLVTVNYRLGIAGFLDLPGAPANRGLLDIVAALRWVRENIAAFGGDPGAVTVFGQSAGATLTGALLATPDADGLFQRAIVQSGNGLGAFAPEQAERVARAAAAALGIPCTAEAFGDVPDDRLIDVVPRLGGLDLRTATRFDPLAGLSPFSIVLDEQPAESVAAGAGSRVALIVGTNTQEGNLYLVPQGNSPTLDEVRATAAQLAADPETVLARYRATRPRADLGELRSAILGDALFGIGSRRLIEAHSTHPAPTYSYEFSWQSGALGGLLGAAHGVEVPYVFDTLDIPALHGPTGLLGPHPSPTLAAHMHNAWVDFARTGDPRWSPSRTHRFTG
ncbi:para-nitrobenzyl esterase [Nocardia transvalensis]|uniref:Carboxylic ester hydrolase n=1 Tax=Nocardia transvalensis TaxID=37333 RepID=A0A7W9UMF3_9NOCA|nr:carboxylesterase family protein [Nocardia transvalensis]MBB5918558.1 para-nitrobenzyl esterase [Nocardia transvalensis]